MEVVWTSLMNIHNGESTGGSMKFGEINIELNYKEPSLTRSFYREQWILRVTPCIWPPELKGILWSIQLIQNSQLKKLFI